MNAMGKRLSALEQLGPAALPPAVKAWLGHALTPAEQAMIDAAPEAESGVDGDFDDIDTSGWSDDLKRWLRVSE